MDLHQLWIGGNRFKQLCHDPSSIFEAFVMKIYHSLLMFVVMVLLMIAMIIMVRIVIVILMEVMKVMVTI